MEPPLADPLIELLTQLASLEICFHHCHTGQLPPTRAKC